MSRIACFNACTLKSGMRDAYLAACDEHKLLETFKAQPGNLYYHVSLDTADPDVIVLNDAWDSQEAFDGHVASEACKKWFEIADKYIESQSATVSTFEDEK